MTGSYFNAVEELARCAGARALSYYTKGLAVDVKLDGSPVTAADRNTEQLAREWIESRFPADGIVGEEFGDVRPDAHRRWIIDPIDGTRSFVRSVPLWGTLVAVAEEDVIIAGCAHFPALGETVVAAVGEGCFWNGTRCTVSANANLSASTVLVTDDRFPDRPDRKAAWDALASRADIARTWGDCYGYFLLATGRAEAMLDDLTSPWDTAALYPIVTEAGGVFTDWSGNATPFGGDAIATNAAIGELVRDVLIPSR